MRMLFVFVNLDCFITLAVVIKMKRQFTILDRA